VSATVDGNRSYRVFLRMDDWPAGHECDCPEGEAGRFCKHCVAACLALSEAERDEEASDGVTLTDVRVARRFKRRFDILLTNMEQHPQSLDTVTGVNKRAYSLSGRDRL
jgi:uncharacterized Zn finger protein